MRKEISDNSSKNQKRIDRYSIYYIPPRPDPRQLTRFERVCAAVDPNGPFDELYIMDLYNNVVVPEAKPEVLVYRQYASLSDYVADFLNPNLANQLINRGNHINKPNLEAVMQVSVEDLRQAENAAKAIRSLEAAVKYGLGLPPREGMHGLARDYADGMNFRLKYITERLPRLRINADPDQNGAIGPAMDDIYNFGQRFYVYGAEMLLQIQQVAIVRFAIDGPQGARREKILREALDKDRPEH